MKNQQKIAQLQAHMAKLHNETEGIVARAESEANRSLTAEENTRVAELLAAFKAAETEMQQLETIEANASFLASPAPRKVTPGAGVVEPVAQSGFRTVNDYYTAVMNAAGGSADPRLLKAGYAGEGTPADGGYAVPPDFRPAIQTLLTGPESLFGKLDILYATSAAITVPTDEDPVWSSSGIVPADTNEGAPITDTKPALNHVVLALAKTAALVYVSSEMLEDVANIGNYVQEKTGAKLDYQLSAKVITAVKGATCRIAVTKDAAAAAGSAPSLANISAMLGSFLTQSRKNGIWLANPRLEPIFSMLTISGASSGVFPIYLPGGTIANRPFSTLYGMPIMYHEACAAIGTEGDLILCDPKMFYGAVKSGGPQSMVSPHVKFDSDLTAFRTTIRTNIQSKLSQKVTRPDGTYASSTVTVQTRS